MCKAITLFLWLIFLDVAAQFQCLPVPFPLQLKVSNDDIVQRIDHVFCLEPRKAEKTLHRPSPDHAL